MGADLARSVHLAKPGGAPSVTELVVTALTELGFQVRSVVDSFGEVTMQICTCPLTEVARSAPEVVRGIQQGLIQEVIGSNSDDLGGPYWVTVRPDPHRGPCEVDLILRHARCRDRSSRISTCVAALGLSHTCA